jgi:hypothetical protein
MVAAVTVTLPAYFGSAWMAASWAAVQVTETV